jgi:hypothetical protein
MRKALLVAILGAAIAGSAAPAPASQIDRASAHAFVSDAERYVRASLSHRLELEAAARRFVEHLRASCPGLLARAPPPILEHVAGVPPWHGGGEGTEAQETTSRTFLTMTLGELRVVGYAPIRAPALAFVDELMRLRWTSRVIARSLSNLSHSILTTITLIPPDLCADARASLSIGFASAPAEATQFVNALRSTTLSNGRNLTALASNLGELANSVRPFLARRDLPALAHFRRLWSRAGPLLQIRGALVHRLLATVYAPGS